MEFSEKFHKVDNKTIFNFGCISHLIRDHRILFNMMYTIITKHEQGTHSHCSLA